MIPYELREGGLTADAELRYTANGHAVASFTLAQSTRRYNEQTRQWETTKALYLPVSIWNETGQKEHLVPWAEIAAGLTKGQRVVVHGRLVTRSWETQDGQKRSRVEMEATRLYVAPQASAGQPPQAPAAGGFGAAPADEEPPF